MFCVVLATSRVSLKNKKTLHRGYASKAQRHSSGRGTSYPKTTIRANLFLGKRVRKTKHPTHSSTANNTSRAKCLLVPLYRQFLIGQLFGLAATVDVPTAVPQPYCERGAISPWSRGERVRVDNFLTVSADSMLDLTQTRTDIWLSRLWKCISFKGCLLAAHTSS